MCEANIGKGFTIVVDQGFMNDVWTGPQILAHHLLKMLVDDIKEEKTCPNQVDKIRQDKTQEAKS